MYVISCQHCGRRSLIGPRRISAIVNDADGCHVTVVCFCGEPTVLRADGATRVNLAAASDAA
jgi:hypothetical protein